MLTILIVEEASTLLTVWGHTLRTEEYLVMEAPSSELALTFLSHIPVNVVISDLQMPGLPGQKLAEYLENRYPATKLILTADHLPAVIPDWIAAAKIPLLVKSLDTAALRQAVSDCFAVSLTH